VRDALTGPAVDPPFGTFALPGALERLRRAGASLGRWRGCRAVCSAIRRTCLAGRPDPFDVEPFPGQRARLYPRDNLSEKRVFGAPQYWDHAERAALAGCMSQVSGPMVFVDAGANAGLYSLAVRSMGPARILAIEPEPGTLARLRVNLAASGAEEVTVAPVALSDRGGTVRIAASGANRGEAAVGAEGAEVPGQTLLDCIREAGLERVDALKIDIEGMEEPVLQPFLAEAPAALRPRLVILEAPDGTETPALALMRREGYAVTARTRLNAILAATAPGGRQD